MDALAGLADAGLKGLGGKVLACGYEAIVAKVPASPYVGGRTLKWLTVKQRDLSNGRARLGTGEVDGTRCPFMCVWLR